MTVFSRTSQLAARFILVVACGVILFHVVMPHHHHDCDDGVGLVFEGELLCHCHDMENEEESSHHPLDFCQLQQALSQLALTTVEKWDPRVVPHVVWLSEDFAIRLTVVLPCVTLLECAHSENPPPGVYGAVASLRAPPAC